MLGMDKLLWILSVWDNENTTEDLLIYVRDDYTDEGGESSCNSSKSLAIIEEECIEHRSKYQMIYSLHTMEDW